MKSPWKIGMSALGIVLASAVVVVWVLHKEKVIERRKLSDAIDHCRRLAEQGDASREFDLARVYFEGNGVTKDHAEALRWYRKAAEQGHIKAQFALGEMYLRGQGTATDYTEALRWTQKAAEENDPKAEAALGYMYSYGKGVPRDYSEGARWYGKAADQGYSLAEQSLAYMYYNGEGVPQDYAEAARLYRKAAEQGDAVAQQGLGYMYATGRGVRLDRGDAIVWYLKAAAQGDVRAKHAFESLAGNFEFWTALIGTPVVLWFSWEFILPGTKLSGRRRVQTAVIGIVFLLSVALGFFAFSDYNIQNSPHRDTFHVARSVLNAAAILILVAFVLRRKTRKTTG